MFFFLLSENGITYEELQKFSEEDVKDLFSTCPFGDRFKIRQLIKSKPEANNSSRDEIYIPQKEPILGGQLSQTSVDKELRPDVSPCQYTAEEMLEKKQLRGKPTEAQSFFHTLIRDAASFVHIWKKAYRLSEIKESKKDMFLKTVFDQAPQLKCKARDVWQRLGAQLQNRRKYIRDCESGKRNTKQGLNKNKEREQINQGIQLQSGQTVNIVNNQNMKIALGIFLGKKNDMYGEVLVQSITNQMQPEELPCVIDQDITVLNEKTLKRVILWRVDRLMKTESKSKSSTSTSSITADNTDKQTPRPSTSTGTLAKTKTSNNNANSKSEANKQVPRSSVFTSTASSAKKMSSKMNANSTSQANADKQVPRSGVFTSTASSAKKTSKMNANSTSQANADKQVPRSHALTSTASSAKKTSKMNANSTSQANADKQVPRSSVFTSTASSAKKTSKMNANSTSQANADKQVPRSHALTSTASSAKKTSKMNANSTSQANADKQVPRSSVFTSTASSAKKTSKMNANSTSQANADKQVPRSHALTSIASSAKKTSKMNANSTSQANADKQVPRSSVFTSTASSAKKTSKMDTTTEKQHLKPGTIAVYEWANGELYFGLVQLKDNKFSIQNCHAPFAFIDKDEACTINVLKRINHSSCTKLNPRDIQINPNENYRVIQSCNEWAVCDLASG